jgi:uncharacterized membrane protein YfhO
VALSGLITVFHLYLSAVMLCLYVPARLVEKYGWKPLPQSRACAQLGAVAFLGVGLTAIVCFGSAYLLLHSPRGSGDASLNWDHAPSLLHLESSVYYVTALLRPFSTDLVGIGDQFRGWENYYEAPQSYCGLLSLLLLPQIFFGASRRERVLYGLLCALMVGPIVFPWFRYLFWFFEGGYFRTFSLFSVFGIITLGLTSLSRYLEGRRLNFWILGATLMALLGVLYLPIGGMQALINPGIRKTAVILLLSYSALLITGQIVKRQSIAGWIILVLAAIELIHFDHMTVSDRPTVTKTELKERVGYNDETVDAVREIKANDNSFFRITKTWGSGPSTRVSYNDAMIFGYNGTMSYIAFNNLDYIKFLIAVGAISGEDIATEALWSTGLLDHPLLATFACEKYVLTKIPASFESAEQYELVRRYGSISLFRNKAFLPFGLIFDRSLPEDIFLQMPNWAKPQALLHAVVLSPDNARDKPQLSQLTLDQLKERMREIPVADALAERRAAGFEINSFNQTRINGTVRPDQKGILLFQMPFDAGWHASMNGRSMPVFRVDAGLLGVLLGEGGGPIELSYRPPFLYAGAAVTFISCLILLLSLWRWPRIHLPN